jgi:uncharacterized protein with HEPN domain
VKDDRLYLLHISESLERIEEYVADELAQLLWESVEPEEKPR